MKPLPLTFEKKGFLHNQIFREEDIAIYERSQPDKPSIPVHFEVVRVRERGEQKVSYPGSTEDVTYPAQEIYPSSEEWGRMGWTFTELPDAQQKAQNLLLSTKGDPK